jgi:hypothetical protein
LARWPVTTVVCPHPRPLSHSCRSGTRARGEAGAPVDSTGTLTARLQQRQAAIAERWLAAALADYPADTAAKFGAEQDPFANPVGHALRAGTHAAVEALLSGRPPREVAAHLTDVVRIRAVQEFEPSAALRFILLLKDALRAEAGTDDRHAMHKSDQWAALDRSVEQLLLHAFDIYVAARAQMMQLRVNEMRRSVAQLLRQQERKMGSGLISGPPLGESEDGLTGNETRPHFPEAAHCGECQRGGGQ